MGMWGRKEPEEPKAVTPSATTPVKKEAAAPAAAPTKGERMESGKAVIGPSIQIKGELIGREDLVVEGSVDGSVRLKENQLTIGAKAKIAATLEARTITVQGEVKGDLVASERVELAAGSAVIGDIVSPRISIADGARFKGNVDMDRSKSGGAPTPNKGGAPAPSGS